ncbi:MAG: cytochrome c [Gemmatimonadetes bacterium]|nr:cytochrome c [Gemmatimonadota bacterium]
MLLAAAALLTAVQTDAGQALYRAWCGSCHGDDGRGGSKAITRLEVPAADLASCAISSAEPEDRWVDIVREGGAAFGLSLDMPAFGENASVEQIRAIVRYTRSLCGDRAWPPGELNFPRPFLTEKAYPENEAVLVARGREQALLYERRIGPRLQVEGEVRTVLDGGDVFAGITAALKYNAWHRLEARALASFGIEVAPAIGRQAEWEIEPFLAFGANVGGAIVVQGEALATFEGGLAGGTLRLGAGRELGRIVPMVEGGWTIPRAGVGQTLTLVPQVWFQLSRLGHVAGSVGVEWPVAGPQPRGDPRLVAFLLWDFGDGPLQRGW